MSNIDKSILTIGVLSIVIAVEVSYAYHSQYKTMKVENTQIKADMQKIKEDDIVKEEMLHSILPGTKITGTELTKFDNIFNEYNIKLVDGDDKETDTVDKNGVYLVTHVVKDSKNTHVYEYGFKFIGEIDNN